MKTFRIWIPIAVLCAVAVFISIKPSPEERAEKLKQRSIEAFGSVSKITLKENVRNIGGEIVCDEFELSDPEEIRQFLASFNLNHVGPGCTCMYSRYVHFTTGLGEVRMVLGPHHFWISDHHGRTQLFVTPQALYSEFEARFGRTADAMDTEHGEGGKASPATS